LCLFFNKISDKEEQDLPATEGKREDSVVEGGTGRNDPNNVCTCK
jgi:hypothetical protein